MVSQVVKGNNRSSRLSLNMLMKMPTDAWALGVQLLFIVVSDF